MIAATVYFVVILWVVWRLPVFRDLTLPRLFLPAVVAVKALACVAYYWYYFRYSSAGVNGDSGDTLAGAEIIYQAVHQHPADYLKMVLGLHSDAITDPLYEPYFSRIYDWGNSDSMSDFFLNDNRTSTRFHALVRLVSGGSYAVHALAVLLVSLLGQWAFFKAFKPYFARKEKPLAIIIFLAPSVLFWSSGILKEPLALALLGAFVYTFLKVFVHGKPTNLSILILGGSVAGFLVLKPYILVLVLFPLLVFALLQRFACKRIVFWYVASLSLIYGGAVLGLKFLLHKDVIQTIVVRQNDFISLSRGGIFFVNDSNYLRLEYRDAAQYEIVDSVNYICRIRPHAPLMYWDLDHLRDTIFVADNRDTSLYKFLTVNKPAGSGISTERLEYSVTSFARLLPLAFVNVLCRPFFFDAHSAAELMASLENLLVILFIIIGFSVRRRGVINGNLVALCLSIVVLSYLLIGITTTVAGAIVRYKVPFLPFLLMIPLLFLDDERCRRLPVVRWFF